MLKDSVEGEYYFLESHPYLMLCRADKKKLVLDHLIVQKI